MAGAEIMSPREERLANGLRILSNLVIQADAAEGSFAERLRRSAVDHARNCRDELARIDEPPPVARLADYRRPTPDQPGAA